MTQDEEARGGPAYPIESVSNALRLLLLLRDRDELRVMDCAAELGVARSTAHRLLAMLDHHGFLRRDPATRTYRTGEALLALGLNAIRGLDIRTRARPYMQALCDEVGETVNLVVLEGDGVRFVDAIETPQALRVGGRIGLRRPAHCTSAGKAILAALPPEELRRLYPKEELTVMTDDSLSSRTELQKALVEIREVGFALARTESDPDIVAVGVRIPQDPGRTEAGIAVSAPASRMTAEEIERCGRAAIRTAALIASG
ncbi:IclR family transcriptional regulator [Plantactinospora sp. S1510]|uniref:IclR family transcriptional regulator n=1 Tax=Plantactinospora alkalitolerans TaxID=2789879 RepID=A0ABS0GRL1_9ACTN|nr:IclR family transcriptional regulator [Plantactinospora alkalitolerans]MBF9128842.1 IclR family transcriptional regulator [Plantactinospora alkalitolerans]